MEKKVVKLKKAIIHGDQEIKELEFREGSAGDLWDLPERASFGDTLIVAGKLCGQPPSVMKKLSPQDLKPIFEVVNDFLGFGQET